MKNPLFLRYTYYHCSKSKRCSQKYVSGSELERQIEAYLGQIQISEAFKNWSLTYLHELQAGEDAAQNVIVQAQEKAYQECLRRLDNLVKLKTSPGNSDGSLLSDEEYGRQRGDLLKEKTAFALLLSDTEGQAAQSLKLAQQVFAFAENVQHRFVKGDAKTKKAILATVGSNLTLKDKRLRIEALKPFFLLGKSLSDEISESEPIEPENIHATYSPKVVTTLLRPLLRGQRNDVRTYRDKAERAAALIYAHFRKEFGFPIKHLEN